MTFDVAIVGAGLSGLSAAVELVAAGKKIVVFDKARAPGGRLATRRIDGHVFDHGAQFLTARSHEFKAQVERWVAAGMVKEWCRGFPGPELSEDGHPRYFCPQGMTVLAKDLAAQLPAGVLRLEHQVLSIVRESPVAKYGWKITLNGIDSICANYVLVTAPVTQATALFSDPPIAAACRDVCQKIGFDPCLALMIIVDPAFANAVFPAPGARRFDGEVLAWGADNYLKGVSPHAGSLTLHASLAFSRREYDADPKDVALRMITASGLPGSVVDGVWQLKKWRYATPVNPLSAGYLALDLNGSLLLTGDAFHGAKVEGAWMSGKQAASRVGS
jgi:renalase